MIIIAVPTRGMLFTEVAQAITEIQLHVQSIPIYTWNMPIPDAHNALVEKALMFNPSHVLFIEEDNIPPKMGVMNMLNANADIACIDYGVNGWSCTAKRRNGEILWCGLGTTLIKREVFERLERPWFRSDKSLRLNDWQWIDNPAKYGGHDIWFCTKAREAGFEIVQVSGEARHLKLDALGQREINNGLHLISDKPRISKQQYAEGGIN